MVCRAKRSRGWYHFRRGWCRGFRSSTNNGLPARSAGVSVDIEVNKISIPFVCDFNTLRIWALILGICCGIALLGVNPRIPVHRPTMDIPRQAWFPKDIHHLKTPLMFLLIGITVFQALGFFPVSLFIPTYTSSLSSATLPSTIVLALFNATSVIFYIVFGHYCDKYPYPYVILVSGTGSALAAFILWGFASSLGWVFAFAVIFGGLVRMFYVKIWFLILFTNFKIVIERRILSDLASCSF